MQNTFSLDVDITEYARIITIKGKIVDKHMPEVRKALQVLYNNNHDDKNKVKQSTSSQKAYDIIVDLSEVSYLDSSMLGALVDGLQKHEDCDAKFYIGGVNDEVRAILELLQLHKIMMIFHDSSIALAYLQGDIDRFVQHDEVTRKEVKETEIKSSLN